MASGPPYITTKSLAAIARRDEFGNLMKEEPFLTQVRMSMYHDMHCVSPYPGRVGAADDWIEISQLKKHTVEAAFYLACANHTKRLRPSRHRRLPPELMDMVLEYLSTPTYVCMATQAAMTHLASIPTGLPPFLNVRLPMIYMYDLAVIQLTTPEEAAKACVEMTTNAFEADLSLSFLVKETFLFKGKPGVWDSQVQRTLHYKFLTR